MVELKDIPIEKIRPSGLNPRKDFGELEGLAHSISGSGILEPLIVRQVKNGYEIVVGERRYLSAKKIGLKKLPAIIKKLNDVQALELMMIENIHRRDLTPVEKDGAYAKYLMHIARVKGYDLSEDKQFHDVINTAHKRTGISAQMFRIRLKTMELSKILKNLGAQARHEYVKRISLRASLGVPKQIKIAKLSEKMDLSRDELEECLKIISRHPDGNIKEIMESVKESSEKLKQRKEKKLEELENENRIFKARKIITPKKALEGVMNSVQPRESMTEDVSSLREANFANLASQIPTKLEPLTPVEKQRIGLAKEREFRKIMKQRESKGEIMTKRKPMINILNELAGDEWLKFTRSWYVFDALEEDLEEERAITIDVDEHPATFSPTMISDYVRFFTKRGNVVLDPFVGIGSTLVACSRAGRKGIGIDVNEKYVEIAKRRIEIDPNQKVILGDAWKIEECKLPKIHYCITSPPYFQMLKKIDVTQKRRIAKGLPSDYGEVVVLPKDVNKYIKKLVELFSKIHKLMVKNSYATVILQNFRDKKKMIPLAWKFAVAMQDSGKWDFKGAKIWCQAHKRLHPFGYPRDWVSNVHHHYCLIFKRVG